MLRLAIRNVFRQRTRTLLTLAAIVLGVASLVLAGGFVEDVYLQLRDTTIHSRLGHAQVYRSGYREFGNRQPFAYLVADADQLAKRIEETEHVIDVMQRLNFFALINNGRIDFPAIGEGVEPDKEARLGTAMTIVSGRQLGNDDLAGILLGKGLAAALKVQAGDFVSLLVTTPDGALNSLEFEVVGIFQTFSQEYDARALRVPLLAAKELLATEEVHSLVISLDSVDNTDQVTSSLRTGLSDHYEIFAWDELADFYKKTVTLYGRQFGILQLIILVMVVLSVANVVNMSIRERIGEFGTLLAVGQRRDQIFRLIVIENALLGAIGAALGACLASGLALAVSNVGIPMPPPPGSDLGYEARVHLVPSVMFMAVLVGVLAPILAALPPAWRASRVDVVDALRQNI